MRVLLAVAVVFVAIWMAPAAQASCHSFTVSATSPVTEGQKTTVTVTRDGSAADSSVKVTTVNGTARSPGDYAAFDSRVSFTGSQTSKSFTITTVNDAVHESDERFSIKVSDGMGCFGSGYAYGTPAAMTIKDNDPVKTAAPTAKPTTAPTQAPAVVTTPTPTASPTPSPTPSATPTPTPTGTPLAAPPVEKSRSPWLLAGAIAGFLAASGGAVMLLRMRRGRL